MNAFAIEHIVIRLFDNLKHKDILSCKLVCKSWDMILANPKYWLKKLKAIGQPPEVSQKWMDLLVRAETLQLSNRQIVKALEVSYFEMTENHLGYVAADEYFNDVVSQLHMSQPPIVAAAKLGLMDIMKLLAEMNEDFDKKHPVACKSCGPQRGYVGYEKPLFLALKNRHFEIADFLLFKTNTLERYNMRINHTIIIGNDMLHITNRCTIVNHNSGNSLIRAAIESGHLDLIKTLLNKIWVLTNDNWFNFLVVAIQSHQSDSLELLIHWDNFVRNQIRSLIKCAVSHDNPGAVKILVRYANYKEMNNWSSEFDEKFRKIIYEEIIKRQIRK